MPANEKLNMTMLCDFYELTMGNGYLESNLQDRITYFDVFYRKCPDGGGFAIAAGLEQIVEYIWSIISSSNAKTLNDINETKIRSALSMQKAFIGMEPAKQKQMFSCLTKLVTNSITSHISLIQEKIQPD